MQLYEWFEAGERVCDPEIVTAEQWRYILTLTSTEERKREFNFIGIKNHMKQKQLVSYFDFTKLMRGHSFE